MKVAKSAGDIPLILQMQKDNKILTLADHQALYGYQSGQTLQYTLEYRETGTTATPSAIDYTASKSTANTIYFILPSSLFTAVKQYHCALKFQYNTAVDYAIDDFDITVYDPVS